MKFVKNNIKVITAFILGVILADGIVYAATSAKDVTYTTSQNNNIKNVEDALNDLYLKKSDGATATLLWTNPDSTMVFNTQTINLDLSEYDAIMIMTKYKTTVVNTQENNTTHQIVQKGKTGTVFAHGNGLDDIRRDATVSRTGVTFGDAYFYDRVLGSDNRYGIITHIYGIKNYNINV